ncbi:E3 ubiquitin-protein ligase highwire-like [Ostrinia nubilalis]|uniref:E3 ubiquitin-protein ligase highwire-like n=1 Tax=Ostrinia nubilalis TaxID=29057 RepID=UPI003082614C
MSSGSRSISTERQFLTDFVIANEKSAGGRLARWLSPAPFVEPDKCELKPPTSPARPSTRLTLPVIVRDQYGDPVVSPALKVEVVVQRVEEAPPRAPAPTGGAREPPGVAYQATMRDNMCFHAITMMKAYQSYSFEELRLADGGWGARAEAAAGRVPAERLPVRAAPDGSYHATWTPRAPGTYVFRCTLDDHPAPHVSPRHADAPAAPSPGLLHDPAPRPTAPTTPPGRRARPAPTCSAARWTTTPRRTARAAPDGSYHATWTPRAPGTYVFRCTLDDHPAPHARAAPDGSYHATWTPRAPGTYVFRCTLDDHPAPHARAAPDGSYHATWTPRAPGTYVFRCTLDDHPAPHARAAPDGSYHATWTPRAPGTYVFRCTLDDHPAPHEVTIEMGDDPTEECEERGVQADGAAFPPAKTRRFIARYTAGLRVRASPSLQAEEVGSVPPGGTVAYVEEVTNKDGTWVRLSEESVRTYTDTGAAVAWCLQHNRHIDRVLLVPVEPYSSPQSEYMGVWSGYWETQGEVQWPQEEPEDLDVPGAEIQRIDRRCPPSSSQTDLVNEGETATMPFVYAFEPSKRARVMRNESTSMPTPRRIRRSNGNADEYWSPMKTRSSDNVRDTTIVEASPSLATLALNVVQWSNPGMTLFSTELEPEEHEAVGARLAQAGTQTSPESALSLDDAPSAVHLYLAGNKDGRLSPRAAVRERLSARRLKRASSPPPLPARSAPPPRKHALSPAQAECLRAIFAALLWHEGTLHDAIACAAFLKFHPQLPKQGARVVTRAPHDHAARHQRHSVEVSNAAGQYLSMPPATLETLTRSGEEASSSRARKSDIDTPINEEDAGEASTSSVVNVLPPALRALVALWDALYDAKQLRVATEKIIKDNFDKEDDDPRPIIKVRQKKVWRSITKTPYSISCELCGGAGVPPPLAAHMRHAHPGCRAASVRGYDRSGTYRRCDTPQDVVASVCGQLAQACQLWYTFCERCREKALKAASSVKQPKTKSISELSYERVMSSEIDHQVIRENAMFLLDLAPLTNSESLSRMSPIHEGQVRSPPTPPGSVWQPAPPFQCLPALGLAPKAALAAETARYHSLGRPPPSAAHAVSDEASGSGEGPKEAAPRVQRSVSMGQAGARDLAAAARRSHEPLAAIERDIDQDTLSGTGVGSSLLSQPSTALQKLVGCGEDAAEGCTVSAFEAPHVDSDALMKRPVLEFVLARRDLHAFTQKLDGTVRINTVRQYAFEALNWLLRSTTQPTCVHDVMWWFCNALEKYANAVPPPASVDDNKENTRNVIKFPAASSMCPGGTSARGARTAFHALLGSVSTLAPSLPPASAAGLQAVRCWALHYAPADRAFLHSKVLSHSDDPNFEEGMLGALHDSFHSYTYKNYVWSCPDVTSWCDIAVSSRQGMAGALTDGSTETFWESGDEDRNKARWIEITYPPGTAEDRPHIVCVHLDNTRDTVNKTMLASFLYSSGSEELVHMQDIEVDPKVATWLCYSLPKMPSSSVRVRCELRGAEPAVRVRQVRVLSAPAPAPAAAVAPARVLHAVAEADALRVFRLLTSQVFGKLLEWERSEPGEAAAAEDPAANDSDLREHVVGILFAGHKLTSLQRQVMSHIVTAIGYEAARVRDDWETALLCAEAAERSGDEITHRAIPQPTVDNYCFEMLALLLALSGSAVGCAHLAQRTELLADLLALLHTGSERVQRQVISLLRRMISEIKPQKALVAINYGNDLSTRVTLLDYLLSYLGKAITVQMKVKGASGSSPATVTMGSSVASTPPSTWFLRGETSKKHAHLVAKLLADMAEDKISADWGQETRTALANYVGAIAQIAESERRPARCVSSPAMWMALAALCVCEQPHIDLINGTEGRESRREPEARPFCSNHDDGATVAVVECRTCGPLCGECDRFLHLNRAARTHQRQICKEEESAIRVDIHEGCGRAKLFWLLLLVDRRTLKALAEFRGMDAAEGDELGYAGTYSRGMDAAEGDELGYAGTCRFCGARGSTGLLAIGNVCADQQCQEHGREACNRVLNCGHMCGGVRCEPLCLPCLAGCGAGRCAENAPLRQDADDMCMICFTEPLQAAPAIQLKCGHVFHLHCCKKVLNSKWIGPRITFSFAQCPICKEDMDHWTLEDLLDPIRRLQDEVRRKALMRLEYEGAAVPGAARGRPVLDPAEYAMERYAYYVCHKCERAYFGGLARCEAETSGWWEPSELVCGACSDVAGARTCPKHGADFLEYKCRYCCSVAVFFCFGTSHFCNACHDDFQRVTNIPKNSLPQCPAGPKGEQLPGSSEECPLHVQHPATGEEFALGCGICRHSQGF